MALLPDQTRRCRRTVHNQIFSSERTPSTASRSPPHLFQSWTQQHCFLYNVPFYVLCCAEGLNKNPSDFVHGPSEKMEFIPEFEPSVCPVLYVVLIIRSIFLRTHE